MGIYGQRLINTDLPLNILLNDNFYNNNFAINNESEVNFDNVLESILPKNYIIESLSILNESGEELIDTKNIKNKVDNSAKSISSYIKDYGFGKGTIDFITYELDRLIKEILKLINITDIYNLKFTEYDFNKIKSAIILLIFVVILNSLIFSILSILLSFSFASRNVTLFVKLLQNIGSGIFGPIIEELAKRIAIKGGFAVEFTVVFNAFEMISYTKKIGTMFSDTNLSKSVLIKNGLFARLKVATMHLSTTLIQYLTSNEKFAKKLGLTQEQSELVGNTIGIVIHSAWNLLAINNKNFNKFIMGKTLAQYI